MKSISPRRRHPGRDTSVAARQASAAPHLEATKPLPGGTRERVLQVALAMVRSRGNAALSLVEVAAASGLSRQSIYLVFGNRAGLLMAIVDHLDANSPYPARLAELRQRREVDFELYLRAWFEYLPVVLPVALALSAAATAGDADARAAWQSRLGKLHTGFRLMTGRLQAEGKLRPGWTVDTAADWMLALTHVDLWQKLVVEAGWPAEQHIARVVATLRETLTAAPAPPRRRAGTSTSTSTRA